MNSAHERDSRHRISRIDLIVLVQQIAPGEEEKDLRMDPVPNPGTQQLVILLNDLHSLTCFIIKVENVLKLQQKIPAVEPVLPGQEEVMLRGGGKRCFHVNKRIVGIQLPRPAGTPGPGEFNALVVKSA